MEWDDVHKTYIDPCVGEKHAKTFDLKHSEPLTSIEVHIANQCGRIGKLVFNGKTKVLFDTCSKFPEPCTKHTFVIGPNEKLIGCKVEYGTNAIVYGITFFKSPVA